MIQASIGSLAVIEGSVSSRTFARTLASDQADWATKCNSDWCWAETREGAVTAASGSTLLRSAGVRSPMQSSLSGLTRSAWPTTSAKAFTKAPKRSAPSPSITSSNRLTLGAYASLSRPHHAAFD